MKKTRHILICQMAFLLFFAFAKNASAQALRSSAFQYQFNQLALNPAYASRWPNLGFEAAYFGNFTSSGQVARSAFVNVQGPTERGGIGGTLQFYRSTSYGELNLRPAYAYRLELPGEGAVSFGATLGLNYFDIDEAVASNLQSDFFSFDGGIGVFFHKGRFFAGLSVLNLFEVSTGLSDTGNGNGFERENPFSLHTGWEFHLMDDIELMPRVLLKYINTYELPEQAFGSAEQNFSFDFQLSSQIQDLYVISLLYGQTDNETKTNIQRFGISASYLLGDLRLTYAFQMNSQTDNAVSLPATHLISAGYELK